MSINNIEKQYNEGLNNLKKKINDYKDKLNQFKNLNKNIIKCNNNYLDLSKEKFNGYIFQGYGFCNAYQNRQFINTKDSSINNQDQCKKICDSKDNCSGFTMFKPGSHVSTDEKKYDNRCYWFKDEPIKQWSGSTIAKHNSLLEGEVMCFKKKNPNMKMCPKETPDCNGGICMSKDSNLENLENEILTLNNDIVNSFVKLNDDYKKYKNSPEMIKISKEIKLLNTIQDLQVEKKLLKMEKEEDITNNFGSRENIFKAENRYYNYLLLVVILLSYSIYSLYRGENYDNIDYIILFLILLYVAYIAYMTFYK